MIQPEEWMDIKILHHQGLSKREIARRTGKSRNTVDRMLEQKTPQPFQKPRRISCLDPYKPYLTARWLEYGLTAPRLLEEVRAQGYTGCLNLVQRFLKTLKDQHKAQKKATVRFETPPGHQAQADWAYVAEVEAEKVYAFVMVLSFSRMLYVEFTHSMDIPTLITCQQNACAFFGGAPHSVLYDNMAQVRLPGGQLNPYFADFAAHYGFTIKTHRVRRPRTKGKVERMVEYVEQDFLNGRSFAGFADLCVQGRLWQDKANRRHHATTGDRPCDLLPRETLTPLDPARPYTLARRFERKVDAEGFVHLDRTRYSVPPDYVDRPVLVIEIERTVRIQCGDLIIAQHPLGQPGECIAQKAHVAAMWKQTLQKSPTHPAPHADFIAAETVSSTPLSCYEEAAQ
jgi:transposase